MCNEFNGAPNWPTHQVKFMWEGDDESIIGMLAEAGDYYEFMNMLENYATSLWVDEYDQLARAAGGSLGTIGDFARWAFRQVDWDHRARMIWDERESYWGITDENEEGEEEE